MRLKFFIVIISLSCPNYADAFSLIHDKDSIILEATTCVDLKGEVDAIVKWTESLGEAAAIPFIDCIGAPVRRIDITNTVPAYFKAMSGKEAVCDGPNCFGFALLAQKVLKHPRLVIENEVTLTLELFCGSVNGEKEPRPGDIGLIRERTGIDKFREIHAFTSIGKTVATKNGEDLRATLEIEDKDKMFLLYKVEPECRVSSEGLRKCDRYVSYFRCDPKRISALDVQSFDELEEKLAQALYKKDSLGELSALQDLLDLVKAKNQTNLLIEARIESLEQQLKRMQPAHEQFLIDIVTNKREELYPRVDAFLKKAFAEKTQGKSFPFLFRGLLEKIIENKIAEFYPEIKKGLHSLGPSLKKKIARGLGESMSEDE